MVRGVADMRDWWRLWTTDSVSLRESIATEGVVRVQGTVRPPRSDDTLVSPIRGEACVAYEYKIYHHVQGTGDSTIDAGIEYTPFVISDGTAEIYVDPAEESLSLDHETETVTREELLKRVDEARLDLDPSVRTESGLLERYIELVEGTLGVGERASVVGKASTEPEDGLVGADAVMTPEEGRLIVTNDAPARTGLRTGARGLFLLALGIGFGSLGLGALVANLGRLVEMVQFVGTV